VKALRVLSEALKLCVIFAVFIIVGALLGSPL
jgi:hypothetical protein